MRSALKTNRDWCGNMFEFLCYVYKGHLSMILELRWLTRTSSSQANVSKCSLNLVINNLASFAV